ncbi:hypothetical protein ABBQ38_013984 [Trebouxia sp. C0009 RCD-2024]
MDNNWEATQKGCVFETLLTKPSKVEGTDQQAYAAIRSQWPCDPAVCRLLFGPKIVTTLLHMGSDRLQHHVSLFNDQYIVKPPRCPQSGFAWHRDSDWCSPDVVCEHPGYLSLWCALDDMTAGVHTVGRFAPVFLQKLLQKLLKRVYSGNRYCR